MTNFRTIENSLDFLPVEDVSFGADNLFDLRNDHGERNANNVRRRNFNCGGYALETYNWFLPYNSDVENYSYLDDFQYKTDWMVNNMIKAFEGRMRVIQEVNDLVDGEFVVAFRVSSHDFHYVKRSANGNWWHKMGGQQRIQWMSKREVFSDCWCNIYSGPLILLALRRV